LVLSAGSLLYDSPLSRCADTPCSSVHVQFFGWMMTLPDFSALLSLRWSDRSETANHTLLRDRVPSQSLSRASGDDEGLSSLASGSSGQPTLSSKSGSGLPTILTSSGSDSSLKNRFENSKVQFMPASRHGHAAHPDSLEAPYFDTSVEDGAGERPLPTTTAGLAPRLASEAAFDTLPFVPALGGHTICLAHSTASIGAECTPMAEEDESSAQAKVRSSCSSVVRNIGPRESLESLAHEFKFNRSFVEKVEQLKVHGYSGWRRVRGDGNCFYRAVGFAFLEQLLAASLTPTGQRSLAAALRGRLLQLRFNDNAENAAHEDLVAHVTRLCAGGGWEVPCASNVEVTTLGTLYLSLCNSESTLDLALIRALRRMTTDYLVSVANDDTAGGGISFDLISQAQGYKSTADFCDKVVTPLGVEAEGIVLSALPRVLGRGIRVGFIDRRESSKLTFCDYLEEGAAHTPVPQDLLHVQLRPGHYDILYMNVVQAFQLPSETVPVPPSVSESTPIDLKSSESPGLCPQDGVVHSPSSRSSTPNRALRRQVAPTFGDDGLDNWLMERSTSTEQCWKI